MGIQKTNLTDEKIKNILQKQYNIKIINIKKIDRGTSNLFKIETEEDKYVLKEFISKRNEKNVIKEANIINFLKQRNILVPRYIKTVNGKYYIKNEGRIIIVEEFIDGYVIEDNTGDKEQVIQCANILGRLTKELSDYIELSDENILEKYFSLKRVHLGINKMKRLKDNIKEENIYKEQIIKDINYRIEILKEIVNDFDFNIVNKLTMLNSHGDFCSQQLIYNKNNEPTIIDFEKAKKLPIVWEVVRSYCFIDKEAKDGDININTLVDYFKEFTKYIKLNKYDLKYAPYLYLLQLASSTYGYKEYNEDFNQKKLLKFAFFRTNLCRSLNEKKEEISIKLLSNIK